MRVFERVTGREEQWNEKIGPRGLIDRVEALAALVDRLGTAEQPDSSSDL